MSTLADAFVRVRPDTKNVGPELKRDIGPKAAEAGQDAGHKFGTAMVGAIKKAAAVLAVGTLLAAKGFLIPAIKQASDLNETASKTQVVFGQATDKVMAFADTAATRMGQSKQAVLDGASTFAIYGKTAGIAGGKLADFSTGLVSLAGDMASFSNTSPEEAIQAIGAAMRGESDPIEKYGVLLNESILKQVAFKNHIIKSTKEALTPQQRVLAVQAALFEQLGAKGSGTMGDFARTSAGLANQQRILRANWLNLSSTVGQALLPVVTQLTTELNTRLMPVLFDLWSKHGAQIIDWLQRMAANIGPGIGRLVDKIQSVDWPNILHRAQDALAKLSPELAKIGGSAGEGFHNTLTVGGTVLKFVADHADLLAKLLPALAVGFAVVKTAQSLETVVAAARIPISVLQFVSQQRTNAAIRAHTAALLANTAAQRGATVAQIADNAATNTGILAKGRAILASIGQRIATIATTVATYAWAAAQVLINLVLSLNPIGIVVLAIAALVAGIVYAYKHSEKFREIVDAAFKGIKSVISDVVTWITETAWPFIKRFFNGFIDGAKSIWDSVSDYLGRVINFVASIRDKITSVASGMWDGIKDAFKDAINFIIRGWNSIHLTLPAVDMGPLGTFGGFTLRVPQLPLLAKGGVIDPQPGGVPAILAEAGQREIAAPEPLMRQMIAEAVAAARSDINVNIMADHPAIAAFVKFLNIVIDDRLGKTAAAVAGGARL